MFDGGRVLIVADESIIALEMADAVIAADGVVVGPFSTVDAALRHLQSGEVAAAILDVRLPDRDISPVALLLAERGVPAVLYTGEGLPPELFAVFPAFPKVSKPLGPAAVIKRLAAVMDRTGARRK